MRAVLIFILLSIISCWAFNDSSPLYSQKIRASGSGFFDYFDFFTGNDPTQGYTNYVSYNDAANNRYIEILNGNVYIGVDNRNVVAANARGRDSVRLTSKQSFNSGLFILDLEHMPTGCGTWPAWWLVGPNWPNYGEIDIIEGVNTDTVVATTLHTSNGCNMASESSNQFTGRWSSGPNGRPATNCYVDASGQYGNQGCSIDGAQNSYGAPFNNANGGVYATEWTGSFIRMWFWPRNQIPGDINNGNPNPSSWGRPYAYFQLGGDCPNSHFQNQQIVFDDTFCGAWAGSVFGSQCPNKGSCDNYVRYNPSAFQNAYWLIRYMAVYQ